MTQYIRYRLKNLEPLRVADDSRSQSGQAVSLDYISGSAVRGYIVNALASKDGFEAIRTRLFSAAVRFSNAYLSVVDEKGCRHDLIPSPKGFYENKKEETGTKKIQNVVVAGKFDEGSKRAGLGGYSWFDNDTIHYYSVQTGSDLKILINVEKRDDRNIFRNDYIAPGTEFAGEIAVPEDLAKDICSVWKNTVILGNARSSGYGKCQIEEGCLAGDQPLYTDYSIDKDLTGSCYLYLLSNTTMRDAQGQYCGLNLEELGRVLGVEELKIERCSTSVVDVRGYNRRYGIKVPSVDMYQAGSVFLLTFKGTLTRERAEALLTEGIGVRRNEGFGKALISRNYAGLQKKLAGNQEQGNGTTSNHSGHSGNTKAALSDPVQVKQHKEDDKTCRIIATCWYRQRLQKEMLQYVTEHPLKRNGASASQTGALEAYTVGYRHEPSYAVKKIKQYFEHGAEKEENKRVHEQRSVISGLGAEIQSILDHSLEDTLASSLKGMNEIMGIPKEQLISEEELTGLKLDLITMMIRYQNKQLREEEN